MKAPNPSNVASLKDRRTLWKMHHAQADFVAVKKACHYLVTANISEDAVYYASVIGVYTMYGRPFTESRGAGKLEESTVPREHLGLHEQLMEHRHKVYAHSDATGAPAHFGNINQVRFYNNREEILPGIIRWRAETGKLKEMILLCEALQKKTKYWINKIQSKYFPHLALPLGQYLINLDPNLNDFLIPAPGDVAPTTPNGV